MQIQRNSHNLIIIRTFPKRKSKNTTGGENENLWKRNKDQWRQKEFKYL